MRAKEYINVHKQDLKHAEIVSQIIEDLQPLRMDKKATCEYMKNHLFADIRYQHYMLQKELFEKGNAMQTKEPYFTTIEGEISMRISAEIREELFHAIKEDKSFGYLFYILGTEQNSHHNSDPIDCIPNAERIVQGISENRDDYPKDFLDGFINDNLNYQQYNILQDGHYCNDDDSIYLSYFNRVYTIYDELRLKKQSISNVRNYLRELSFENEVQKFWTLSYIVTLINEIKIEDDCLNRCKQELIRIIEPIKKNVIKDKNENQIKSPVYLSPKKGNKLDIIRVFNSLYELGKFVGKNGDKITKKEFFIAAGNFMNLDLEHYDKDLSNSTASSVAFEKQVRIFNEMKDKMIEIYNKK